MQLSCCLTIRCVLNHPVPICVLSLLTSFIFILVSYSIYPHIGLPFTYMIYQFYIHNKNLLYTAGVSSILVCRYARQVGPCSYKPKEVCNFGAPAVSTFLSGIYLVYCIPYTYITQTQNIYSIRKKFLVTLAVVSSRRNARLRVQTLIFTIGAWRAKREIVSFRVVRACARCLCEVSSGWKSKVSRFPFSLLAVGGFPFSLAEWEVRRSEIPPPHQPHIQLWLALSI